VLCCRGYFLTRRQKEFVGIDIGKEEESDDSVGDSEYASVIEKFLSTVYAEKILTLPGRITVLMIWAVAATVAIYGIC